MQEEPQEKNSRKGGSERMQDGAREEDTRVGGSERIAKKERNEGTHVNKLCRKQEVQAGRTKPEKQGHKRKERLTGTDRNKQG